MARVWFKKAARQNSAQAQFALGRMYDEGIGVQQDKSRALQWIKQAAAQNYGEASRWLKKNNAAQ